MHEEEPKANSHNVFPLVQIQFEVPQGREVVLPLAECLRSPKKVSKDVDGDSTYQTSHLIQRAKKFSGCSVPYRNGAVDTIRQDGGSNNCRAANQLNAVDLFIVRSELLNVNSEIIGVCCVALAFEHSLTNTGSVIKFGEFLHQNANGELSVQLQYPFSADYSLF